MKKLVNNIKRVLSSEFIYEFTTHMPEPEFLDLVKEELSFLDFKSCKNDTIEFEIPKSEILSRPTFGILGVAIRKNNDNSFTFKITYITQRNIAYIWRKVIFLIFLIPTVVGALVKFSIESFLIIPAIITLIVSLLITTHVDFWQANRIGRDIKKFFVSIESK